MRLHSYRDESHSRHFDLIGGGGHPWSIDLVSTIASGILVVGFACAFIAHWGNKVASKSLGRGPRESWFAPPATFRWKYAPLRRKVRAVRFPLREARISKFR